MTSKLDKAKKALEVANELGLWDKIVRFFRTRRAKRKARRAARR